MGDGVEDKQFIMKLCNRHHGSCSENPCCVPALFLDPPKGYARCTNEPIDRWIKMRTIAQKKYLR